MLWPVNSSLREEFLHTKCCNELISEYISCASFKILSSRGESQKSEFRDCLTCFESKTATASAWNLNISMVVYNVYLWFAGSADGTARVWDMVCTFKSYLPPNDILHHAIFTIFIDLGLLLPDSLYLICYICLYMPQSLGSSWFAPIQTPTTFIPITALLLEDANTHLISNPHMRSLAGNWRLCAIARGAYSTHYRLGHLIRWQRSCNCFWRWHSQNLGHGRLCLCCTQTGFSDR